MSYDFNKHPRHSLRLKGYDYSQPGGYYITICTQGRRRLFGEVAGQQMILGDAGRMIDRWWSQMPHKFPNITLDEYVTMPDHFHGIIIINNDVDDGGVPLVGTLNADNTSDRAGTRPAPEVGDIIGAFKSLTTNEYIHNVRENGWVPLDGKLWQRSYWEHIIRDEREMDIKRQYIIDNPTRWHNKHNNNSNDNLL